MIKKQTKKNTFQNSETETEEIYIFKKIYIFYDFHQKSYENIKLRKICYRKASDHIDVKNLPVGFNLSLSKDVMTFNLTDPKYSNSNKLYGQEYEGIKLKAIQTDTLFKDEFFPPKSQQVFTELYWII